MTHMGNKTSTTWRRSFVFVRFRPGTRSLSEQLEPIESWVAPYRTAEITPLGKPTNTEINYNWKIIHDVDNEGYHVVH